MMKENPEVNITGPDTMATLFIGYRNSSADYVPKKTLVLNKVIYSCHDTSLNQNNNSDMPRRPFMHA